MIEMDGGIYFVREINGEISLEFIQNYTTTDIKPNNGNLHGESENHSNVESFNSSDETNKQNKEFPCTYCQKILKATALTKHYKEVHLMIVFICRQCGDLFDTLTQHFLHCRQVHKKEHPKMPLLQNGSKRKIKEKVHKCDIPDCNYSTSNGGTFMHHIQSHAGIKPYVCRYCDKEFTQKSNCHAHEKRHFKSKAFPCHECSVEFTTYDIYLSHLQTRKHEISKNITDYTTYKPAFVCYGCNKELSGLYACKAHRCPEKIELKDEFWCKECGKNFAKNGFIAAHILEHLRTSKLLCPICQENFDSPMQLSHHLTRTHELNVKRPHVCRYCKNTYDSEEELREHINEIHAHEVNTRNNIYGELKCELCDFSTFAANAHANHYKENHPEVKNEIIENQYYYDKLNGDISANINKNLDPKVRNMITNRKRGRPRKDEDSSSRIIQRQEINQLLTEYSANKEPQHYHVSPQKKRCRGRPRKDISHNTTENEPAKKRKCSKKFNTNQEEIQEFLEENQNSSGYSMSNYVKVEELSGQLNLENCKQENNNMKQDDRENLK